MKKSQAEATTAKNLDREWSGGNPRHGRWVGITNWAECLAVERCGKQLRYKFDRGEDVLDYFDVRKARVIDPQSKGSAAKGKFAYPKLKQSAACHAEAGRRRAVREKSARYRKKK